MKKVLIIGFNKESEIEPRRMIEEARQLGLEYTFLYWRNIIFDINGKELKIVTYQGKDVRTFDLVWARNPYVTSPSMSRWKYLARCRLWTHFSILVEYMNSHKRYMLNRGIIRHMPDYNKLLQQVRLQSAGLPIIPSRLYTGRKPIKRVYEYFPVPYIVKEIRSSRGQHVIKVQDPAHALRLIETFGTGQLLVQKFLPITADYRVLVLGKRVLGTIERRGKNGNFKTNFSAGGSVKEIKTTPAMEDLALRGATAFDADFAGVDIIVHRGVHYILEVNFFPGFAGFEKATGLNIPSEVYSFLLKQRL